MKVIFIKHYTNICSSTTIERHLTFPGLIHSSCRSNVSDNNFNKLVSLKGNQEFILKRGT